MAVNDEWHTCHNHFEDQRNALAHLVIHGNKHEGNKGVPEKCDNYSTAQQL